ncbi:MAG: FAD-dependent oxidoreductase [Coriobacteriaceae bacterium]|jgi:succinate dehydrogenase/fumarate reductase flavoprotein subunit|nr:FAD-dependent oxidoreductase [Coriobacteriaceae bacterium]
MKENKGLSRRDFLKGAALTASGAAAVALSGCAQGAQGNTPAPATSDAVSGTLPGTWDLEADVVVVGGGVGMAAAIEAADAGADTVLLEAGDHVGGLWIAAGGSCTMGGNNVVQQRDGEKDSVDDWYKEEMYSNDYRGDPDIMRMLCEKGADTVKWLEDLGIVWAPLAAGVLRGPVKRGIQPAENPGVYVGGQGTPNSGICWIQVWEKKLKELQVPIQLNTRMTKVWRDGTDGPVVGVEASSPDGTINIKAKRGVVLATGTWTDNALMAKGWDPRIVGENCYGDGGVPAENLLFVNSAGDGHLAASRIGAQFSDMSFVSYLYLFFGSRSYWGWGEDPIDWTTNENYAAGKGISRSAATLTRTIIVNGEGERYVDESTGNRNDPGRGSVTENPEWPFTASYLAQAQPRNIWLIGDSTDAAELKWPLDEITKPNPRTGAMFDPACIAIADTISDLAGKIGVPAAKLQSTIERYNGFADSGTDEDFGKKGPLTKIETGPFYAFKASLIRHTQRNGLRVNTKSQVIDGNADYYTAADRTVAKPIDSEPVIPRLYAAGELANSLGWRRPHNSLGHYTTVARNAGMGAAGEKPL